MSMPMSWESMGTASLCRGARHCWPPSPYWNCAEKTGEAVRRQRFDEIEEEVRTAAYKIIEAKSATYYGIGMALTRITKAILGG